MKEDRVYDYVIIGSGFGGSVSAMRLAEKGYKVLIVERGRRFADDAFAKSDWNLRKHLWAPLLRCFGIWQNTLLNGVMVMHGSGYGGGSLVYANALVQPDDKLLETPAWQRLADWKRVLAPHFETARKMLGVTQNKQIFPADNMLRELAAICEKGGSFRTTPVGVYFNDDKAGETVPDPYFGGQGPDRAGCDYCGGCMLGCRKNAKNTLVKNYLFFAEKYGAEVKTNATVTDIQLSSGTAAEGVRFEVVYHKSTALPVKRPRRIMARNVIVAAGAVNTNRLLLRCRDHNVSLPNLSKTLGQNVRTNNESLTAVTTREFREDYTRGVCNGAHFMADDTTRMEMVRFPAGSGATMAMLSAPLAAPAGWMWPRFKETIVEIARDPVDFLRTRIYPELARRSVILLTMQTNDNRIGLRLGRNIFTLFRKALVCDHNGAGKMPSTVKIAYEATRHLARKMKGIPLGMASESLLNIPGTVHLMGGVPFGRSDEDGVIGLNCQVHNYPGLYVVDGAIMPANPGVNPSLTITALAEYAMDRIPPKAGARPHAPLMKE